MDTFLSFYLMVKNISIVQEILSFYDITRLFCIRVKFPFYLNCKKGNG